MADTKVMSLADGRELAWLELGDPQGSPVFAFHGTPGSHLQLAIGERPASAARVRLIAPDRPGYGHSSLQRDRRLIDWAGDVAALADHLGMNRFAVIGVSGGGPHSAVCARLLPDRVSAAGIISGLGPLSTPGAEQHMKPANRAMFRLARTLPTLLYALSYVQVGAGRRWPERTFRVLERQFPMPDIEVLRRPEVRETMFIDDLRQAPPTAARAAAQEFALFAADWGFRLEDIAVPVHLWHGDLDRNVPISHGRAQAERIPGATFHECPGEAHLLIVDHFEEILHTVTESA